MINDHANYDKAQKEALFLLKVLGYVTPPVSPLDVAAHLNLTVREVVMPKDRKNVAGFIDIPEQTIFVNKEDPINRRIFTIAHEIGHYVLHREAISSDPLSYSVLYRDTVLQNSTAMEKEANTFAANLLVPESMLSQYKDLSPALIAGLFGVSQQVVTYRLANVGKDLWGIGSILPQKK